MSNFFLYRRIMQFGHKAQSHKKVNSIVNCRNRESTDRFTKQNAKTHAVYYNNARDAATAYSSIKGIIKIMQN